MGSRTRDGARRKQPVRHKDRILAAFRGEPSDRIATAEQTIASSVASDILGRPALTGSTSLHYEEAKAWALGESAHREFVDRCFEDIVAVSKALDLDAIYPPWRGSKPTRRVDEYTFVYGREDSDRWVRMSFDPASQTYGICARARDLTLEDIRADVRAFMERVEKGPKPSWEAMDEMDRRFMVEYGAEYAIPARGGGMAVPVQPVWLEATVLDRGLVEAYLDAVVENNLRWMPVYKQTGFAFVNGGGDFADKNGPMYSPRFFRDVMAPRWRRIFDCCRELDLPYVFRSDGNLWPVADDLFGAGRPAGYGEIDWEAGMDAAKIRAAFPGLTLFGNVPCGTIMLRGRPEDVAEATRHVVRAAAPRVVVGTSNSIMHGTPAQNVYALYEAARAASPQARVS